MATFEVTLKVEIPDWFGDFHSIEQKIKQARDQAGLKLMAKIFEAYERRIFLSKGLRRKDRREKDYETTLGSLRYARWRSKSGLGNSYYPIDEWLGLKRFEKTSVGLKQAIIEQCVTKPYAKASRDIEKTTGIQKSAMTHWRWIQQISAAKQSGDKNQKVKACKEVVLPQLMPEVEDPCSMLGIDPDATYVRPRRKLDKNHELKLAVLYTGKEPVAKTKGRLRWALTQKQVVLSDVDEKADAFFSKVTHKAIHDYALHSSSRVICHGDGDSWIKQLRDRFMPQALNRLDPYHAFKKMSEATGLKDLPSDWIEDFYKNPKSLIGKLKKLKRQMAEVQDKEKLESLINYFRKNIEGMEPSKVPKEIKQEHPGMYRRGSGTIESNIDWVIGARFKRARMNWSKQGLKNLSYLRQEYLNQRTGFKKTKLKTKDYKVPWVYEMREVLKEDTETIH